MPKQNGMVSRVLAKLGAKPATPQETQPKPEVPALTSPKPPVDAATMYCRITGGCGRGPG